MVETGVLSQSGTRKCEALRLSHRPLAIDALGLGKQHKRLALIVGLTEGVSD